VSLDRDLKPTQKEDQTHGDLFANKGFTARESMQAELIKSLSNNNLHLRGDSATRSPEKKRYSLSNANRAKEL